MHIRIPGKLSEIYSKVVVFSNPGDNIRFLGNLRDRLVPLLWHFMTLSLGLEITGTLECISDSFPGTLIYVWILENSWNSAPMCSSSPIQGTMSWLVLKFHIARIWESNIMNFSRYYIYCSSVFYGRILYVGDRWHLPFLFCFYFQSIGPLGRCFL